MAWKDIVVSIKLMLDPAARMAFEEETAWAIKEGTNPKAAVENLGVLEGAVQGLRRSVNQLRQVFLVTLGGRIIADFIKGSIDAFLEFDKSLNAAVAVMENVSDVMRNRLASASIELSKELNISAVDLNKAYYELASAGLTAEQTLKAIPIAAAFAKAGLTDVAESSRQLLQAMTSLGYANKDPDINMAGMARVADVLSVASKNSLAHMDELVIAINNKAGPAFRQYGKSVEEAVAGIEALAESGIVGTRAGERLTIFMRSMTNAALQHKKAFHEAGIEVFDHTGKVRDLADIVDSLTNRLGQLTPKSQTAELLLLGISQRAIDSAKSFLGMGDAIRKYEDQNEHAQGATEKLANNQLKSLAERLGVVQKRLEAARIELGESFTPALEDLGDVLGDEDNPHGVIGKLRSFGDWIRANHELVSNFAVGGLQLLIAGMTLVADIFNYTADVIVLFTSESLSLLTAGFEGSIFALRLFLQGMEFLGKITGSPGLEGYFQEWTEKIDKFGTGVDKFRTRLHEAADLAREDIKAGTVATPSIYRSPIHVVDTAFKNAAGNSVQTTTGGGTDNSVDVKEKGGKDKLPGLLDRLNSMVASTTDDASDDLLAKIKKLEEGFHTVFGDHIPKAIQATLDKLKSLATDNETVHKFSEQIKDLKTSERPEDRNQDIQSWITLIAAMEAALPNLDKESKAYRQLAIDIGDAEKELAKLNHTQNNKDFEDLQKQQKMHNDYVKSLASTWDTYLNRIAGTWQRVFSQMGHQAITLKNIMKEIAISIASSLIGGLGEFAMKKAAQNSLNAAEQYVEGIAALSNPLTVGEAPAHFHAAEQYAAMSLAWAAASGAIGGISSAVASSGGGGAGASHTGGTNVDNSNPQNIVNIYIDGVDPKNPRHQQLIGDTAREYMERAGTQVFTNPGRR